MRSYYYGDSDSDSDSDDDNSHHSNKSNRAKPTCNKPDHTPSEPDHHKRENGNTDPTECGYNADRENEGTKGDRETDGNRNEPDRLAYEGNETHERERLERGNDEVSELRELEYLTQRLNQPLYFTVPHMFPWSPYGLLTDSS